MKNLVILFFALACFSFSIGHAQDPPRANGAIHVEEPGTTVSTDEEKNTVQVEAPDAVTEPGSSLPQPQSSDGIDSHSLSKRLGGGAVLLLIVCLIAALLTKKRTKQ